MSKLGQFYRVLSVFLCLCMLVGILPAYAMAAEDIGTKASSELAKGSSIGGTDYHVTSLKNYAVAPDISERVIITNNDAGNSQTVANVMEVNTANGRAKIVAGYGNRNPSEQGWTLKTTTQQAHVYEKETGLNVVGGVNASWFNIDTGEPSGYLVMNGVVHHDNSARAYLAAFDDGSVNVFKEGTTLAQAEANQSAKQGKTVKILEAVDALVAMVWDGEVVISESGNGGYYPRTCVGIKADGTVVLFQADGTMAPRSVGYTAREEANMMVALGCVSAIQLDEGGSSTYISQREGENDLSMRNTPAGGSERGISGTILVVSTVAASGEFDHAAISPDDEYFTPESTVALTAKAMDSSGAPAKALPQDISFSLSDESMGTISDAAVNGSSASATFTSSGKTGDVTVNMVSGGKTVGSAKIHIQNPEVLSFASADINLNYNDVSDLGFKATYQTERVNLKDGDITWSITDEAAGSFSNNLFTATSNVKYSGSPTVTAVRGDLKASITVNIGMEPTMIIDGGDADPWDYSAIGTTVESFTGMAANAVATYHYGGRGGIVKGSIVSDTDEEFADIVRFGHNAVKLEYDWTGLTGTDGACLGLGDNLVIDGTPTALGVWVYIPEGVPVPWIRAQIATSTNGGASWTNAYINFSGGSTSAGEGLKVGWQYLEADMTQYAGAMIRINSGMLFRAMVTTSGIGWFTTEGIKLDQSDLKGYILLDNLCVVYGANNQDVTSPVVSSIQLVNDDGTKTELEDGAVLNSADLRFFVEYNDSEETDPYATGVESAYFYFDGTYRGTYDRDTLGSTSALMHFGPGLHSITFYLKDGYGNVTRETRFFTVEAAEAELPSVQLDIVGTPTVGKPWELTLSGNDLSSITSLTATISLTRGYPATATFPEGVTGSYSYDAAKGTVMVDISKIDHAVFNADKLATVAVDIPTSVVEGSSINVSVTKGNYGCTQTDGMDISVVNQYVAGFTTPISNYPVEAMYRIQADTAVVGSSSMAKVTVIADDKPAVGISVYADDELLGVTDENGQIDISSLTAAQGNAYLRAADEDGNCSFQISLYSYDSVGDETGAPYNIIYNLAQRADGKTITWMANPSHSAAAAVLEISTSADMSGAERIDGSSRLISYSSSKQINRVNAVSLSGLTAGTTYYYRVGDGSVWSDVRSFTVPASGASHFYMLADIQEEEALDGLRRIANCLEGHSFGIQLGDAVDNVRYYNQWEDALSLFSMDGIGHMDMLHVIGNHEADDDGNGSIAARTVFGIPAAWYSVERGDVYIAVLNHTSNKDSLQEFADWLVEDAAKSSCTWKILVTHVPAYYTNPTGGGETYIQYLPAACDAAGIDFYFAGNDHSYARTAPMLDGKVDENGTVYYICGSTGGKSYAIVNNPDFNFEAATIDFSSVFVDFDADSYQATVTAYDVDSDGSVTVLDQYTKRTVPLCENDEHTYVYDRDTHMLSCEVCGFSENAVDEKFSGFVHESLNHRLMYLVAGVPLTGYMHYENRFYFADDQGIAYDGEYDVCGETCLFKDGFFVSSPTADVLAAGRSGTNVDFILYADGLFKFIGTGENYAQARVWNSPWYSYRNSVKKIFVDNRITNLDKWFAYSSRNLTEVVFADGSQLTRIDQNAFSRCSSLQSIKLPDAVTYIGYNAFTDCTALKEIYLPDGINAIMPNAFTGDKEIVLNVGYGSYAKNWAASHGLAYVERAPLTVASGTCGDDLTWTLMSDGVLTIDGTGTMSTYYGEANIPWYSYRSLISTVNVGAGVTKLTTNAFCGCAYLKTVNFADNSSLQMIGGAVFKNCSSLVSINLPEGLTIISGNAFKNCRSLREVYLPDTMSSINNLAFADLTEITFSVAEGSYAEQWAKEHGYEYTVRSASDSQEPDISGDGTEPTPNPEETSELPVEMPETPAPQANSCGSELTWKLENKVLEISGKGEMDSYSPNMAAPWAEYADEIEHIIIGKDVEKIGAYAFKGLEKMISVSFEDESKLTVIEEYAFADCKELTEIILPDKLEKLGEAAFTDCEKLTKVIIPESLVDFEIITIKPENPDQFIDREPVDVFDGCNMNNLVLVVIRNSAAEMYASEHGIAVQYDDADMGEIDEAEPNEEATIVITPDEPEPQDSELIESEPET